MKERLKKIIKTKIFLGVVCFLLGAILFVGDSNTDEIEKLDTEVKQLSKTNESLEDDAETLNNKIEFLNRKVEKSELYLSLNDDEKQLVDSRINEVKKATQEEKDKLKAEEEAKKAEEEARIKAEEEAKIKAEEEAKAKAEQEAKEAEAQKYNTGLTYDDLARNPESNAGKYVLFSGKILQVTYGDVFNIYRFAVNDDINQTVMIVVYTDQLTNGNILEDDYLTIKGLFMEPYTYTTVLGAENTVPLINVDEFSFN